MAVEFRDLRWAIAASQHKSLRRTAETLSVRQSTLSRSLRGLEHQVGAQLFERTNGGTRPTTEGLKFLDVARRLLDDLDTAIRKLNSWSCGERGRLTVGVYTSLAAGNLRATLVEHRERFPDVDIRTVDGSHDYLFSDLTVGMIDVIIMASSNANWEDCTLPLWSERVIIALPVQHHLSARSVIRWNELKDERLLLPERDPGPEFEQLLATKLGWSCIVRAIPQAAGLDRLLSLVGIGRGLLLVLEGTTGARYDGVVYREVHDEDGPTRLHFSAYWRHENNNPALRPFLDILRARYPDLGGALGCV